MAISSDPYAALDELNHDLCELRREHGQVLRLDDFRDELRQRQPSDDLWSSDEDDAAASEAQLRHELAVAYSDLGAATFALVHHDALTDVRLATRVQRIYEVDAQLAALARATCAASA